MGRGAGAVDSGGGHPKIFELKGGAIPKVEGGRVFFTGKCTGLMGHSGKIGGGGG